MVSSQNVKARTLCILCLSFLDTLRMSVCLVLFCLGTASDYYNPTVEHLQFARQQSSYPYQPHPRKLVLCFYLNFYLMKVNFNFVSCTLVKELLLLESTLDDGHNSLS